MKRFLMCLGAVIVIAALVLACGTPGGGRTSMTAGTYTATVPGYLGAIAVEVRTSTNAIADVRVTSNGDTPGVSDWAVELIPQRIVEHQSLAVDVVSGVTMTSMAIRGAVMDCLTQAGADIAALSRPPRRTRPANQTLTADVVVVGGGGAGLAAAASATEAGASVILIEKTGFLGGNTIVSGGAMNTAWPAMQDTWPAPPGNEILITRALAETPVNEEHRRLIGIVREEFEAFRRSNRTLFDSPSWHALQSWEGGDRVGDLRMLQVMTNNSLPALEWLMGMGLEIHSITQAVGGLYPRAVNTRRPNGAGWIEAFSNTLAGRNYTQLMETAATGLIMDGNRVVGVNAEGRQGNRVTLRANRGVILATGGFAANVELRQQYAEGEKWPYLGPTLITSNVSGVTGDGIFFARDAGAHLVNMDQIQLLHYTNPVTGSTGDIVLIAAGVETSLYVNRDGNRFVREDGRRDEISIAALAQPGGYYYQIISSDIIRDPATAGTIDGRTLSYMLENNLSGWVTANTLEGLAAAIGANANNLAASVREFNNHVVSQTPDRFGRTIFQVRLDNGPWYAFPRAPATHHTMGGILIDEYARALRADGTPVRGLYAAGEITGVLHGANRLGANALTDVLVFGRIAGTNAAAGR